MRIRIPNWIAVLLLALTPAPGLHAQTAMQGAASDLSGVWMLGGGMSGGASERRFLSGDPPLQPAALAKYRAAREGIDDPNQGGLDRLDPSFYCFPPGPARSMIMPFPFEIIQGSEVIYILFEFNSGIRRIYLNRQKHPDDYPETWMGHSIGRWDGNALVADTGLLREGPWLDRVGTPYSDALRIVERFRRLGRETLEVAFEFHDEKAFTGPWVGTKQYELQTFGVMEYVQCEEHLQMGQPRQVPHP